MSTWRVICDFDGTICALDVTDDLLSRFALPQWVCVEQAWKAGKISARECMAQQIRMLRVTEKQLNAYLATIEIDPDFYGFVMDCKHFQLPLQIVSDGMSMVIQRILALHGLDGIPVIANRMVALGPCTYALEFPYADASCVSGHGTCKCAIAMQEKSHTLLIGDGASDFCLAKRASFVFAKNALSRYCADQGIAYHPFSCFAQARVLLSELVGQTLIQNTNGAFL